MTFHSPAYGLFLVVVFALFWLVAARRGLRTALLLAASWLFYGSYGPWLLCLIGFSTLLDWHCGQAIHRSADPRRRRLLLAVSLVGNLGVMGFFKYYDWAMGGVAALSTLLGSPMVHEVLVHTVPVGISFYTFQTLSYSIDIYRGKLAPARSLLDFALFVSFFPQLVAGPIVRAVEFLPQLESPPRLDRARLHGGLYRIAQGLLKKVVLADVLGAALVDPVFADPGAYGPVTHALAIYGFTLQLYLDFSAYSDIAIGSAALFGFVLPENFDLPLQARSIREFWRRWHISLSSWLRDYLYFPLGGSKRSEPRVWFNLTVTMLLIGIWHGAHSLWIVFGLLHAAAVCLERGLERWRGGSGGGSGGVTGRGRDLLNWLVAVHFIFLTVLMARAQSWGELWAVFTEFGTGDLYTREVLGTLGAAMALHLVPSRHYARLRERICALPSAVGGVLFGLALAWVAFELIGDTPFIYFQF